MNIKKLKDVFDVAYKANRSVKMVGPHGIGKSQIVEQWAKDNGFHCEVLQLPLMDEGDMIGIPETIEKNGERVTTWAMPIWLQRITEATKKGVPSVLFLDELGRASTGIRQVAPQLVLENRLQEHDLGTVDGLTTLKIVADNPSDEYDTAEYDPALESRFMTFDVDSNVADWLEFARDYGVLPVVSDFIAEFPNNLRFTPESDDDKGSNPRSWIFLSDVLKANREVGNQDMTYSLIVSEVGKTVGGLFSAFLNDYVNVMKPKDVTKIIGKINTKTEKGQRKAAELLSERTQKQEVISAAELGNKLRTLNVEGRLEIGVVVAYIASLATETQVGIMKDWKRQDPDTEAWFKTDFANGAPDKWLLVDLISQDVSVAKKDKD